MTKREAWAWADVWPVTSNEMAGDAEIVLMPVRQALRSYRCFWLTKKGERVTMAAAYRRLTREWPDRWHHVASLARRGVYRPVIVVRDGTVIDGNHTLLAAARAKPRGQVLVITA